MLLVPKLLLSCLQQLGGLQHVLLILVLLKASAQHAGKEPILVPVTEQKQKEKMVLGFLHNQAANMKFLNHSFGSTAADITFVCFLH